MVCLLRCRLGWEHTSLAIIPGVYLCGQHWSARDAMEYTYIGGRQAKKPSNREWFELHCCGSSQEWA